MAAAGATAWPNGRASAATCLPSEPFQVRRMRSPSASATPANTSRVSHLQLSEAEDAQTLDPALIDDPTSLAIGAELFQGLTRLDATLRPVPALAQSWEITDSGRAYTFHLRAAKY